MLAVDVVAIEAVANLASSSPCSVAGGGGGARRGQLLAVASSSPGIAVVALAVKLVEALGARRWPPRRGRARRAPEEHGRELATARSRILIAQAVADALVRVLEARQIRARNSSGRRGSSRRASSRVSGSKSIG